jgi:hypothetical protein
MTVDREKPFRRAILSSVSFWAVAAIGLLAAATNAAAPPLYRFCALPRQGFGSRDRRALDDLRSVGVA